MTPDLTDEDKAALIELLCEAIEADRFPHCRVRRLNRDLVKAEMGQDAQGRASLNRRFASHGRSANRMMKGTIAGTRRHLAYGVDPCQCALRNAERSFKQERSRRRSRKEDAGGRIMRQCTLMRIFGFILAVVGSITSHDAQANVITQTHNFGSSPIFNGDVGNSIFNQFDPSLGNLTGVGLGVSGDATFSVDFTPVYCDDPDFGPYNCSDVTAAFFIGFYFLGPGLPPNPSAPFLNPNDNFSYSLNSNTPETAGPVTIGAGAFINPLTGYVGTGDVFIDFLTGVDVFCDGSGVSVFCSDNADLSLSLTYTYTPVPEPNTILLLITSVGLMGVVSLFASSRILRI